MLPTTSLFALHFGMLYPVNAPEWSLFFELAANFFYASIARWLNAKRLVMLCALSGAVLCLVVPMLPDALNVGHRVENFFWGFPRVVFSFFLGVLLFRYRPLYRLNSLASLGFALILNAVLLAPFPTDDWAYDLIAVALIFPTIVLLGSVCECHPMLTVVWLWLGELSYPLYITHHPVVRLIKNAADMLHLHVGPAVISGACIAGSIIAAQLLLTLWDRPIRARLGAALRGLRAASTSSP
jgi:peptidoglycan/LPS O-acetylase OafA/YrhL